MVEQKKPQATTSRNIPGGKHTFVTKDQLSTSKQQSNLPYANYLTISNANNDQIVSYADRYWRLCNYLSVVQIYLQDNFLLEEELQQNHIKARLLGHFGSCPGVNLIYTHCNLLLQKYDECEMFFVLGPGHAAPSVLSNLYVEGSLESVYPQYDLSRDGLEKFIKAFSWPSGFPSHVNSQIPGVIHEGGELGYALSVSYGAVMDNPNLVVCAVIGDGESETGPTATSWHCHKFIDPSESGAVLPILHLNRYKIASRSILSCMEESDLISLFIGYGYNVFYLKDPTHLQMFNTMEMAYQAIREIQKLARENNGENKLFRPKWPMIILDSPKGWTGPKVDSMGNKIENNHLSHQVPLEDCKDNEKNLKILEEWLRSYKIEEIIDFKTGIIDTQLKHFVCPKGNRRMGTNRYTNQEALKLNLPSNINKYMNELKNKRHYNLNVKNEEDKEKHIMFEEPKQLLSPTKLGGEYLKELIVNNLDRFRIFSPDELVSNKLTSVLDVTSRNFNWESPETMNKHGKVIEILSEHVCQGFLQGYTLTGRYGLFPSYESFLGIIATMMVQYSKFKKMSIQTNWRYSTPSINYVESSTFFNQPKNGYSHQNPGFINIMINMKSTQVRIYLPPDANSFISVLNHCVKSKDKINLIVASKKPTPLWLSPEEAMQHCNAGASIWKWACTFDGLNPDVVLCGIGSETNIECLAAAALLRQYIPEMRVRFINVVDIMILQKELKHPHGLSDTSFNSLFTKDKKVIVNFHGYPSAIKGLLFGRSGCDRFEINGYIEEGTTTTAHKLLIGNHCSRFDVAIQAIEAASEVNEKVAIKSHQFISYFKHCMRQHEKYINKFGEDPNELDRVTPPKEFYEYLNEQNL